MEDRVEAGRAKEEEDPPSFLFTRLSLAPQRAADLSFLNADSPEWWHDVTFGPEKRINLPSLPPIVVINGTAVGSILAESRVLGCFLSHFTAMQYGGRRTGTVLFLEEDAWPDLGFAKLLYPPNAAATAASTVTIPPLVDDTTQSSHLSTPRTQAETDHAIDIWRKELITRVQAFKAHKHLHIANLARCFDYCQHDAFVTEGFVRSELSLCSAAYIADAEGLETLTNAAQAALNLPKAERHTAYDDFLMKHLDASATPRLFRESPWLRQGQGRIWRNQKPECKWIVMENGAPRMVLDSALWDFEYVKLSMDMLGRIREIVDDQPNNVVIDYILSEGGLIKTSDVMNKTHVEGDSTTGGSGFIITKWAQFVLQKLLLMPMKAIESHDKKVSQWTINTIKHRMAASDATQKATFDFHSWKRGHRLVVLVCSSSYNLVNKSRPEHCYVFHFNKQT